MKLSTNRTSLALLLTVAAIAVPCAAWYVVGSREANNRARELEEAPQRLAREAADRLADRLRDRLETLRENEGKRPFFHYQNFYHDPRGAYEGAAVVPSPLAQGPLDPLIRTYFQLDASGRFSLPQLTEMPGTSTQTDEESADLVALRKQLELQAPTYVAIAGQELEVPVMNAAPDGASSSWNYDQQAKQQPQAAVPPTTQRLASRRVEVLEKQAWQQNVAANEVYSQLRAGNKSLAKPQNGLERIKSGKGNVEISVGALRWHTLPINGVPALVALRDLQTPYGRVVQGFLVAQAGVADVLRASPFPAQFLTGSLPNKIEAVVPLDNTRWTVAVDARLDLADARARARAVRTSFQRMFGWGVTTAAIAGLCVVGLVWQTERLARQRSQFAASAAHELRTPLAGLRLYSDMLADGLGNPASAQTYARRVADEAERLGRVVANVLGFSRLERGAMQVHLQDGDLGAAVREAVTRQLTALEALGASVELAVPDALPRVRFDADAFSQIIQNLLDNAEKHTRHAENRQIRVALTVTGTQVQLAVADHGPGVTRQLRRRLFRPFVRGNDADAPAGLGLGLTLVRALVRAHNGTVRYADAPGGGACFVVTLPA